jgi:hypothetical protein
MVMTETGIDGRITGKRLGTILVGLVCITSALEGCSDHEGTGANHLDSLPRLVAQANARIGDFEDPDLGFSRVVGLDVDEEGSVYILEGLVPEIRVYSPEGVLLRRIGRRGSGPGEFESSPRFGVFGDTVWTVDSQANRITLFDRQGTVLSTGRTEDVLVPLPSGFAHVLPWKMRPDGKFTGHLAQVSYRRNDPATGVNPTDSIPVPMVLFNSTGAVTDTIGWAGRPPPRMWRPPSQETAEYAFIDVGGRRVQVPMPPSTLPWWLPYPDGYVLVETPLAENATEGVLTLTRIGLLGDTVYSRDLLYSPSPYSSEDLDSISVWSARGEPGGMTGYVPGRGPPDDWEVVARHLRGAMEFPGFQLPISYPWLAQDGGIWLLRTDEGVSETVTWVLLDAEGEPRGQVDLAPNLRIIWSSGDTFWAVEPDEFDVPWVVRFELHPG